MTTHLLTDRQIGTLYQILVKHNASLEKDNVTAQERYERLLGAIDDLCNNNDHPLSKLEKSEKEKVRTVLETFLNACPDYQDLDASTIHFNLNRNPQPNPTEHHHHYYYPAPSYYRTDFLGDWMLINAISGNNYGRGYSDGYADGSGRHGSQHSKENDKTALLLFMLTLAIAASFSVYYALSEIADSVERFCFHEGWLQASVTLMGISAAAAVSTILASLYASGPIMSLAISSGMSNPAGWAVFGVIALGLIGASVGGYLTNVIQNQVLKYNYAEAFDPSDPHRFALTSQEEKNLLLQNIDPIKVKCAIAALRLEMKEEQIPSFFNRFFSSRSNTQEHLDKVRQLRKGELGQVKVGKMKFNLLQSSLIHDSNLNAPPHQPPQQNPVRLPEQETTPPSYEPPPSYDEIIRPAGNNSSPPPYTYNPRRVFPDDLQPSAPPDHGLIDLYPYPPNRF